MVIISNLFSSCMTKVFQVIFEKIFLKETSMQLSNLYANNIRSNIIIPDRLYLEISLNRQIIFNNKQFQIYYIEQLESWLKMPKTLSSWLSFSNEAIGCLCHVDFVSFVFVDMHDHLVVYPVVRHCWSEIRFYSLHRRKASLTNCIGGRHD